MTSCARWVEQVRRWCRTALGISEPDGPPSAPAVSARDGDAARRLAAIVGSSYDAIVGKTLDGRITDWNAAAEAMFGYTAQEAIGRSVNMLIPEGRAFEEMRIIAELSSGQPVPPFDTVRRTKDGRLLDVSITVSPIRDAKGAIIGAAKIARDVTARRRAQAALRESEARLRFTLEKAHIGDWQLDLSTERWQGSAQHDRCFGFMTPQIDWTLRRLEQQLHAEDRESVMRQLRSAMRSGRDFSAECRVVWPDGSVHWISLHGTTGYHDGPARHMTGIVADITRQRTAEAARADAERLQMENHRIQEATRAKSLFLATMSHELRTPLNAIIGFADVLSAGVVPRDSPQHDVFLGHILTSGRHLLQLINDVLDLSKVEAGRLDFYPEPVDLAALAREVSDVLHTQLVAKSLRLELDVPAAELRGVVLDPARLKQVLFNYLSNAVKFTPAGGLVVLRARADGTARFRIEVQDTGPGIAPEDLKRLFTDFTQLDSGPDKRHEGTGLGLALSKRLVEAQGGSVGVRSSVGAGSTFFLLLDKVPRARPAEAATVAAGSSLK